MITKQDISTAKITAMKEKNSFRSQTLGSILAAVKQQEVDTRVEVSPESLIGILNRMVKQRQESIAQFQTANRQDLVENETKELDIIKEFLPAQASQEQIDEVLDAVFASVEASKGTKPTVKDLGSIMPLVKEKLNGKADMAKVSQLVKGRL